MARDYEPQKMKQIAFAGIGRITEKVNQMSAAGKSVVRFQLGQPDFDTPANIKEAAKRSLDEGNTSYTSNYGMPALRKAIAEKLERMNDLKVDPNSNIMVTCGAQEALAAVISAFIEAGDEVLIGDPSYLLYANLVKLNQGKPVFVPLLEEKNFEFDLDFMEKAITDRTRLLILNAPGNPTGTLMSREHLEAVAAICEKHDILVIADEAYEQVIYDGQHQVSFATLPGMFDRTITLQSFSKSYSMCGWRIGYAVAPKELMRIIIRAHHPIVMSANSFAQAGAIEALNGPQDSVHNMVAEFDRRRSLVYNGLKDAGIPCAYPQAAFYLFPDISQFGMNCTEFADYLLDNYGVATVPGVEFGAQGEGHVRISYATSYEACAEGVKRIKQCAEDLRAGKE